MTLLPTSTKFRLFLWIILGSLFLAINAVGTWTTLLSAYKGNPEFLLFDENQDNSTLFVGFKSEDLFCIFSAVRNGYEETIVQTLHDVTTGPFSGKFVDFTLLKTNSTSVLYGVLDSGEIWQIQNVSTILTQLFTRADDQDIPSVSSLWTHTSNLPLVRQIQTITTEMKSGIFSSLLLVEILNGSLSLYNSTNESLLNTFPDLPARCGYILKMLTTQVEHILLTVVQTANGCVALWKGARQISPYVLLQDSLQNQTVRDIFFFHKGMSPFLFVVAKDIRLNATIIAVWNLENSNPPRRQATMGPWNSNLSCWIFATNEVYDDLLYLAFQDASLFRVNLTTLIKPSTTRFAEENTRDWAHSFQGFDEESADQEEETVTLQDGIIFCYQMASRADPITTLSFNWMAFQQIPNSNGAKNKKIYFPTVLVGRESGMIQALFTTNSSWILLGTSLQWTPQRQSVTNFVFGRLESKIWESLTIAQQERLLLADPDIDQDPLESTILQAVLSDGQILVLSSDYQFLRSSPSVTTSNTDERNLTTQEYWTISSTGSLTQTWVTPPMSYFILKEMVNTGMLVTLELHSGLSTLSLRLTGYQENTNVFSTTQQNVFVLLPAPIKKLVCYSYEDLFKFRYNGLVYSWIRTLRNRTP